MKNQSGISLVELLAALALLGIISILIGSVLSTGTSSAERTSSKQRLQQEANYIEEAIRAEYLQDKDKLILIEIVGSKLTLQRQGESKRIISEGYEFTFNSGSECEHGTADCRQINPSSNAEFHLNIRDRSELCSIETTFSKLH